MAEEPVKLPKGKFFYIVGRESGLVLEIQDAMLEPGTPVVLGEKRDIRDEPAEALCQMWYNCLVTNTIRCRANANLAFTLNDDDQLVVDIVQEEEGRYMPTERQQWAFNIKRGYMKSPIDGQMRFIEVADHGTDPGTPLIAYEETGDDNQKFDAEQLDSPYFMLVSEMSNLCMEADTGLFGGVKEGQKIVTSKKDGKDQQLWYEDVYGVLRTKVNNFAIECFKEPGAAMRASTHSAPRGTQHWHLMPNRCWYNRGQLGYCLDIAQRKKKDGAKVVVWEYNGGDSQRWKRDFDIPIKKKKQKKSKKSKTKKADADSDDDDDDTDDGRQ